MNDLHENQLDNATVIQDGDQPDVNLVNFDLANYMNKTLSDGEKKIII
jgi:hypothetical protein